MKTTAPPEPERQTDDPVVQVLIDNVKDESAEIRAQAAKKLQEKAENPAVKAAVPALSGVVTDDLDRSMYFNEANNKDAALEALKALAPEKVKPTLLQAAKSKSTRVKEWAVEKLTQEE